MKKSKLIIPSLCFAAFIGIACLWDKDTIEMERQEFPDTYELIIGKFLRHSPEFYQWRIQDCEKRIKNTPDSVRLYDDLAVAHSKLHNNKTAIKLMLTKDSIMPRLYETYANLGTFYIHDGQLAEGLEYIKRAIKMNPEAHFGRETYQQYVVEYILQKYPDGKIVLPLNPAPYCCDNPCDDNPCDNFYSLLLKKYNQQNKKKDNELPYKELKKALKGIQGMMKFGNYDSPVLLEVLGDLLISVPPDRQKQDYEAPARHLAIRAYIKASKEVKNNKAKKVYLEKVRSILYEIQEYDGDEQMKSEYEQNITLSLEKGITEGEQFYEQIRKNEMSWIAQGMNPEVKFDQVYYKKVRANRVPHIPQSEFRGDDDIVAQREVAIEENKKTESSLILPFLVAFLVVGGIIGYALKKFRG